MSTNEGFAISRVCTGDLNALVKNLMKATGIQDANEVIRSINAGEWQLVRIVKAVEQALLELVGTVTISATTTKFVAVEKFVVNTASNASVKISGIGSNFDKWFLADAGTIEEPIIETVIRCSALRKRSVDGPILTTLGGRSVAMTGLTHVYSMMEKQPHGTESASGQLLTNGWANIFYVPQAVMKIDDNHFSYINKAGQVITEEISDPGYLFEVNGVYSVLRVVSVYWHGDGWNLHAYSVLSPNAWDGGFRVFSHNSALISSETLVPA